MIKKFALCLIPLLLLSFAGCKLPNVSMPFNGDITFHDLSLTVPTTYIRDSTQSNDDFWLFEKDNYATYIMLSRRDAEADATGALDDYCEYLTEQGATSERTLFLGQEAVHSVILDGDNTWQEIFFVYNGSLYAVSLRGKDTADFQPLIESVSLGAQTV